MSICYNLLREKKLSQCRQILETLGIKVSLYQNLNIKKNYRCSLQSLEKGSILAVEDLEYFGNTFFEVIDNLSTLIENEITLVCLNTKKVYRSPCPEYSFLSSLNRVRSAKMTKISMARSKTTEANGSKIGRRSVYTKEVEAMVHSLKNTNLTIKEICQRANISKSTYYAYYNQGK